MKSVIALAIAVIALAAGCGGESTAQTTYTHVETPRGYHNLDGSPPWCVVIRSTGEKICNTDASVVELSQRVYDGELTNTDVIESIRYQCTNEGWSLYLCNDVAVTSIQLVIYNLNHGVPQ